MLKVSQKSWPLKNNSSANLVRDHMEAKPLGDNSMTRKKTPTTQTRTRCCHLLVYLLRTAWYHQQRVKQMIILIILITLVIVTICLMLLTPLPVYILDRLNLRSFYLPKIRCDNCTHLPFKYLINNQSACANQQVFLLNVIVSHHANVIARTNIRNTWGAIREYKGYKIKTMFAFGVHEDYNLNNQLQIENNLYHDIIQGDFKDHYKNLTQKSVMVLHWFTNHCQNARYMLKTDDDSFNNPKRYIDYLHYVRQNYFIGGYCFTVMPDRRDGSKYFVPYSVYPDIYYPTYCTGPGYILSQQAAVVLLAVSPNVIYVSMEDVFIAGMCRVAANLTYTQIPGIVVGWDQLTKCDLATWTKNTHNIVPEKMLTIWQDAKTAVRGDCLPRDAFKAFILFALGLMWTRHLVSLTRLKEQ